MMRFRIAAPGLMLVAALILPTPAGSATAWRVQGSATATLTVHAHVVRNCIISAQPIDFGNYDPLVANRSQPLDATSSITFRCTKGGNVHLDLDDGQSGGSGQRRMVSAGTLLDYQIYQDVGRSKLFSTGNYGANEAGGQWNYGSRIKTVYGRIPGGQNVPPGDYTDTLTATIIF